MRPTPQKNNGKSTNDNSSFHLPKQVKQAGKDIINNVANKEKERMPHADDPILKALNYYTFHYVKKVGSFAFYALVFLTCCQLLYPQAPLRLSLSLIVAVIIFATSLAFSKVFIYRMVVQIAKKARAKKSPSKDVTLNKTPDV